MEELSVTDTTTYVFIDLNRNYYEVLWFVKDLPYTLRS